MKSKYVISVWHIPFSTGMALIGIVERNTPVTCLSFKFLRLLDLVFVELRRGYSNTFAFPITNNRTGNTNVCFV